MDGRYDRAMLWALIASALACLVAFLVNVSHSEDRCRAKGGILAKSFSGGYACVQVMK